MKSFIQWDLYPFFLKGSREINNEQGKQQLRDSYLYRRCAGTRENEQCLHENNACGSNGQWFHCSLPNIMWVIKSRRMRRVRKAAHVEMRNMQRILIGKLKGRKPFVRSRHKQKKQAVKVWSGFIYLLEGTMAPWQAVLSTVMDYRVV